MYTVQEKFISKNRTYKNFTAKGMVLHETADPGATDESEYNYFNGNIIKASAHGFLDNDSITKTVPFTEKGLHACEPANSMFLGIEMCRPKVHDEKFFTEVYNRAVWWFADTFVNFLKITNITKDNLMSHDEVRLKWNKTSHTDPTAYFKEYGKTMDIFRQDVQNTINSMIGGGEMAQGLGKCKILATILNVRNAPEIISTNVVDKVNQGQIFSISEVKGDWFKIDKGWILTKSSNSVFAEKFVPEIKNVYNYKYNNINCKVIELNPLDLRISVQDKAASLVSIPNMFTSVYQTWEKTDVPNKVKSYPLGILMSDGVVISNRQPHKLPCGTLIIYKDGKVEVKEVLDITKEPNYKNIKFAVSGLTILPKLMAKESGFVGAFTDVLRRCPRPVIGYNKITNKIVLCASDNMNVGEASIIMKQLGCERALALDAGGSTVFKSNGQYLFTTTRQLYAFLTW